MDERLKFDHPDALRFNDNWKKFLNGPLSQTGIDIDQVTRDLVDHIISNDSPTPKPGFNAFISTGAASVSVLESAAASMASPQRYMITAFKFLEELFLRRSGEMFRVDNMQGIHSNGGSVVNLIAMGGARKKVEEVLSKNCREETDDTHGYD